MYAYFAICFKENIIWEPKGTFKYIYISIYVTKFRIKLFYLT